MRLIGLAVAEKAPNCGADEGDLDHSDSGPSVVIEKNDRSLDELARWYKDGRLTLDPEWQRNYVWSNRAASRLIESFLIDLPVPVIYLARDAEGTYEVIDGLQRLTSVVNYFDGKLRLTGLEIQPKLNGKTFRALERPLQNKLRDVTVRTFELAPNTSKDLMFAIFERLNSGGTALNDMEIRNCLYRGSWTAVYHICHCRLTGHGHSHGERGGSAACARLARTSSS